MTNDIFQIKKRNPSGLPNPPWCIVHYSLAPVALNLRQVRQSLNFWLSKEGQEER